jgi:hypothetical protein
VFTLNLSQDELQTSRKKTDKKIKNENSFEILFHSFFLLTPPQLAWIFIGYSNYGFSEDPTIETHQKNFQPNPTQKSQEKRLNDRP